MLRSILYPIVALLVVVPVSTEADPAMPMTDPPAAYDLRDVNGANYVTSVKSQSGGTCWTHGAMAAIESNMLITGSWALAGEDGEPNLAEYHLDWWNGFNQHNNDDTDPPTGGGLVVHEGGDYLVTAAYLTRGEGAVRDIDGQSFQFPPDRDHPGYHKFYVRDIEWYELAADNSNINDIKFRIMTGGALGTCTALVGFSSTYNCYYQPPDNPNDPVHAVAITGWDDNKVTQAPDPGAWLCKNSWGTGGPEGGYFWVAYDDKHTAHNPEMGAVALLDAEPMPYDFIYSYDYHGWRDTKTDCSEAFSAFTAREFHQIDAVGFYAAVDNITYTVNIYDRFEAGELLDELATHSGTITYRGYHTIDLDSPVSINSSDDFYVYVQLSDGGQPYDRTSDVPVLLGASYRTMVESKSWPGESYYRDGGQWYDLYDFDTTANFCIKALAVEPPSLDIIFPDGLPLFIEPDQPTTFNVRIVEVADTYVSGTAMIYYQNHDSIYVEVPLVSIGGDMFEATLPPANIGSIIKFYFSAEAVEAGLISEPSEAPVEFHTASAGEVVDVYTEDFETGAGWTVDNDPGLTDGAWELGIPVGGGDRGDPPNDYDGSGSCFLTGNTYGDSDVDDGTTYLTSPPFDLTTGDGMVSYARWYSNDFGSAPFGDVMRIHISNDNGYSWTTVDMAGPEKDASGGWKEYGFRVGSKVTPSSQVRLRFAASDMGDTSIVEAAVDAFSVTTFDCSLAPLAIVTETLPDWTAGHPYSQFLTAYGGFGVYKWLDMYMDLEGTGLNLSLYGSLSGTPTTAGTVSFTTMLADDAEHTDMKVFTFTINVPISITTASLPDWTVGIPYSVQIDGVGGTGGIAWDDKNSDLEGTGLSLSSAGLLSGTPGEDSTIEFTAVITDDVGATGEQLYSITINASVSITTETLPLCVIGEPYTCSLACNGGTTPLVWSDRDNDLAGTGLTLSAEGVLSGTVDSDTSISFTTRLADYVGYFDEREFVVSVMSPYVCGDANDDKDVNVGDAVYIISYVFAGGPPPYNICAADANGDDEVNVGDAVYLINYIFKGGPPPVEPCCP